MNNFLLKSKRHPMSDLPHVTPPSKRRRRVISTSASASASKGARSATAIKSDVCKEARVRKLLVKLFGIDDDNDDFLVNSCMVSKRHDIRLISTVIDNLGKMIERVVNRALHTPISPENVAVKWHRTESIEKLAVINSQIDLFQTVANRVEIEPKTEFFIPLDNIPLMTEIKDESDIKIIENSLDKNELMDSIENEMNGIFHSDTEILEKSTDNNVTIDDSNVIAAFNVGTTVPVTVTLSLLPTNSDTICTTAAPKITVVGNTVTTTTNCVIIRSKPVTIVKEHDRPVRDTVISESTVVETTSTVVPTIQTSTSKSATKVNSPVSKKKIIIRDSTVIQNGVSSTTLETSKSIDNGNKPIMSCLKSLLSRPVNRDSTVIQSHNVGNNGCTTALPTFATNTIIKSPITDEIIQRNRSILNNIECNRALSGTTMNNTVVGSSTVTQTSTGIPTIEKSTPPGLTALISDDFIYENRSIINKIEYYRSLSRKDIKNTLIEVSTVTQTTTVLPTIQMATPKNTTASSTVDSIIQNRPITSSIEQKSPEKRLITSQSMDKNNHIRTIKINDLMPSIDNAQPSNIKTPMVMAPQSNPPMVMPSQSNPPIRMLQHTVLPMKSPQQIRSPIRMPQQIRSPIRMPQQIRSPIRMSQPTMTPMRMPQQTISPIRMPQQNVPPIGMQQQHYRPPYVTPSTINVSRNLMENPIQSLNQMDVNRNAIMYPVPDRCWQPCCDPQPNNGYGYHILSTKIYPILSEFQTCNQYGLELLEIYKKSLKNLLPSIGYNQEIDKFSRDIHKRYVRICSPALIRILDTMPVMPHFQIDRFFNMIRMKFLYQKRYDLIKVEFFRLNWQLMNELRMSQAPFTEHYRMMVEYYVRQHNMGRMTKSEIGRLRQQIVQYAIILRNFKAHNTITTTIITNTTPIITTTTTTSIISPPQSQPNSPNDNNDELPLALSGSPIEMVVNVDLSDMNLDNSDNKIVIINGDMPTDAAISSDQVGDVGTSETEIDANGKDDVLIQLEQEFDEFMKNHNGVDHKNVADDHDDDVICLDDVDDVQSVEQNQAVENNVEFQENKTDGSVIKNSGQPNCFCGKSAHYQCVCANVVYCSRYCQLKNWDDHLSNCDP